VVQPSIKNHVMVKYGKHFGDLCQPIFKVTPINYIGLARIYEDGSRSYLITNPSWGEVLLNNKYHLAGTEDAIISGPESSHQLWSISSMFALNVQTRNLFKDCIDNNYGNGITLVQRGKRFVEFFHICTDSGHQGINPYLDNNVDQLWKYILYLKECINNDKELRNAYNFKYYYDTKEIMTRDLILPTNQENNDFSPPKKYYLGGNFGDIYFSPREIDCLKLLYKNHTAKEQAKILGLSPRTIECNLEQIKKKTNARNQAELIVELTRNSIFTSLIK